MFIDLNWFLRWVMLPMGLLLWSAASRWHPQQRSTQFVSPAGTATRQSPSTVDYCTCHHTVQGCCRRFMSTSWRHLRLMSASLSIPTLAITMFDVFCRDFLEGGGVFAETRMFLSPLLPKDVWLRPTCIS